MKKFLSLFLSVCLLTNTVVPAFAAPGGGRILRRVITTGGESLTRTMTLDVYRQIASSVTLRPYLAQIPVFTQSLQAPATINVLAHQFQQGEVIGLGERILSLPVDRYSTSLMRNEMVGLSLQHQLPPLQYGQAISFYQEQVAKAPTVFSAIPKQASITTLSQEVLKGGAEVAESSALGMFADAVALGLTGTERDIASLLEFYKSAKGTVFEEAASTLVGRSLLRMEAYGELNDFITQENPQGQFWADLPAYAKRFNLDIVPSEQTAESKGVPPIFKEALRRYGSFATLAGDFSATATKEWVTMGKGDPIVYLQKEKTVRDILHRTAANQGKEGSGLQVSTPLVLTPAMPITPAQPAAEQLAAEPAQTPTVAPVAEGKRSVAQRILAFIKGKKLGDTRTSFPVSVMDANGAKRALPVTFSIGNSFKVEGYNEVVFREDPRFENGYIVELHDHGKTPLTMEHFYMALYTNEVGPLVRAAQKANVTLRIKLEHDPKTNLERVTKELFDEETGEKLPVELDIQLGVALWAREAAQAFSHWMESVGMPSTHKDNPLVNAKFFLRKNGEVGIKFEGSDEIVPLPEDYYIRLPKHQIQQFVKMEPFLAKGTHFEFVVSPTVNRANMVSREASLTNVSLGKTMGSVVNGSLDISEASAKSLMFGINYVLPGFASMLTPVLKKYGEKNLLTLSLAMSVGAGALATAGGFYGFVESMALSPVQKGMFIGALLLMSGASIIKQLVSNMLIAANRGEVVLTKEEKAAAEEVTEGKLEGFKLIAQRVKDFFTKKSTVSLTTLAKYNEGFIYKNIGTLAFLASPFAINYGIKLLTGVDLGLDYSISFPLYAGYSAYVAWKVLGSKLRDAYTAKNLIQSQQMVRNMIDTGAAALTSEKEVSHTVINDVARSFKDSLDALAFAHIKLDPSKNKKLLYNDAKEKVLAALENKLIQEYKMAPEDAAQLMTRLSAALKVQENNLGNMWTMIRAPGVASLTAAMVAATTHEFVISSSFSGIMKGLISEGEFANFLIASSLYVPLIAGRLGGNWISRRISPDSMYILCSSLSAIGTGIMATANGSVPQTIAGAVVASLGVGNFFTQMYDYIMRRYPKQNRELSSVLALTMGMGGLAAIPAGYMAGQMGMGVPVDLMYAGGMLAASLILTPRMMRNSSFVIGIKQEAQKFWQRVKSIFRGGDKNPGAGATPAGGDAVPVQ